MSIAATMAADENVLASPRRAIFAPDIGQHHVARPALGHSNAKRAWTKQARPQRKPGRHGRNDPVWRARER
jgi:hypothetical protein